MSGRQEKTREEGHSLPVQCRGKGDSGQEKAREGEALTNCRAQEGQVRAPIVDEKSRGTHELSSA